MDEMWDLINSCTNYGMWNADYDIFDNGNVAAFETFQNIQQSSNMTLCGESAYNFNQCIIEEEDNELTCPVIEPEQSNLCYSSQENTQEAGDSIERGITCPDDEQDISSNESTQEQTSNADGSITDQDKNESYEPDSQNSRTVCPADEQDTSMAPTVRIANETEQDRAVPFVYNIPPKSSSSSTSSNSSDSSTDSDTETEDSNTDCDEIQQDILSHYQVDIQKAISNYQAQQQAENTDLSINQHAVPFNGQTQQQACPPTNDLDETTDCEDSDEFEDSPCPDPEVLQRLRERLQETLQGNSPDFSINDDEITDCEDSPEEVLLSNYQEQESIPNFSIHDGDITDCEDTQLDIMPNCQGQGGSSNFTTNEQNNMTHYTENEHDRMLDSQIEEFNTLMNCHAHDQDDVTDFDSCDAHEQQTSKEQDNKMDCDESHYPLNSIEYYEHTIMQLKTEINQCRNESRKFKIELNKSWIDRCLQMEKEFEEEREEKIKLFLENQANHNDMKTNYESEILFLKKDLKSLQDEMADEKTMNQKYAQELSTLREENESMKKLIANTDSEKEKFNKQFQELVDDYKELEKKTLKMSSDFQKKSNTKDSSHQGDVVQLRNSVEYYKKQNEKNKEKLVSTKYRLNKYKELYRFAIIKGEEHGSFNIDDIVKKAIEELTMFGKAMKKKQSQTKAIVTAECEAESRKILGEAKKIEAVRDDGRVQCPECEQTLSNLGFLNNHLRRKHKFEMD